MLRGPAFLIGKIVDARYNIFKAKVHQIRFPLHGTPPQTPLWELTNSLAVFKGPISKGREGERRGSKGENGERGGMGTEGGRERGGGP